jgi:hypothetical protein
MGEYAEQVQTIARRPTFVGGRFKDAVLYFDVVFDGWMVRLASEDSLRSNIGNIVLWSKHSEKLPMSNSWTVFEQTKVPAPGFRVMKSEAMLEVTSTHSLFGEGFTGTYSKQAQFHDGKPTYSCGKECGWMIWFKAGFGWCVGDGASIGTHTCAVHADDFAPSPDAVHSMWMVRTSPVADPRVQAVLASAESSAPAPHPATASIDEPRPAASVVPATLPLPLSVAVVGVGEGYSGLYKKQQNSGGRTPEAPEVYESADNRVIWQEQDSGQWFIGARGSDGGFGRVAAMNPTSSPITTEAAWHLPERTACSSIRVTKSKKKHTKVVELKGVPTADKVVAALNGKYRQQKKLVDGRPTFKGGQDSMHAVWYSADTGSWRVGPASHVATSVYFLHAKDTATSPNTVKATWYVAFDNWQPSLYLRIIAPSAEAADQEVPRQMQLKIPEVMAAEEKRCLSCGHEYASAVEVVFHEECMHHNCMCCSDKLGSSVPRCAVCAEEEDGE